MKCINGLNFWWELVWTREYIIKRVKAILKHTTRRWEIKITWTVTWAKGPGKRRQALLQHLRRSCEWARISSKKFWTQLNRTCKQGTKMGGEPIVPVERWALTLRFLATGEIFRSLHFQFTISRSAISYIMTEVCEAIPKKLGPSYLKVPSSEHS